MARAGIVRLDGQRVGRIEEVGRGTRFTYDTEWLRRADAQPLSLVLPLREEPFEDDGLHPWFENLLPEGWLFDIATTKLRIAKDDAFGLLLATCRDCVGAAEIIPEGEEGEGA